MKKIKYEIVVDDCYSHVVECEHPEDAIKVAKNLVLMLPWESLYILDDFKRLIYSDTNF